MSFVLVTGATGRQGGATARALLKAGVPVRALVRDPSSQRAKAVEALGADLVPGNLLDLDSVRRATEGARAVFSIQMPDMNDPESEGIQGRNLVDAAAAAGVPQFVHTSVSGLDKDRDDPDLGPMRHYYESKAAIQDRVRAAGFRSWTLLKPAFFMDNFDFLMPQGPAGGLATVLKPGTMMSLVAPEDIGVAAAMAIQDPDRFHEIELELTSDYIPMSRVAEILSSATGLHIPAPEMTGEEAVAAGAPAYTVVYERLNATGQPARPEFARALGIPLTSFETWAHARTW